MQSDIQLSDTKVRQYFWTLRDKNISYILFDAILFVLLLLLFEYKIVNKKKYGVVSLFRDG